MSTTSSYVAFLPQRTPCEHGVLAVVDRGDGPESDELATPADAPSVTMMAAVTTLKGIVLRQVPGRGNGTAAIPQPSEIYPLRACDS